MQHFDAPVLVTGASGYVASWIVHDLLAMGATVHATVRNPDDPGKVGHLTALATNSPGQLKLFAADLLEPGAFAQAMQGCKVVIHTASPFFTQPKQDAQKELIEPALKGTENVLNTASQQQQVERVVLTSSVVAVYGDGIELAQTGKKCFDENDWNRTSSPSHQPYAYSKTVAEQAAWKLAEAQNRWQLSVINPGFVMGPSLTSRKDSSSIEFMCAMINGKYRSGVPHLPIAFVDVREVAQAHIQAALRGSNGRHLLVAEALDMWQMAQLLRAEYSKRFHLPMLAAPKWLLYLIGPSQGLSREFIRKNVGLPVAFDNRKSRRELTIDYRPLLETFKDHIEQLVRDKLV